MLRESHGRQPTQNEARSMEALIERAAMRGEGATVGVGKMVERFLGAGAG